MISLAVLAAAPAHAQSPQTREMYASAVRALEQGRYAQAKSELLQVVESDPSFAGAWLDLALAAYGNGEVAQAEEFLGILEARFQLPEAIASGVKSLRSRIQDAVPASAPGLWEWRQVAQAGLGWDSNANAGLVATDLTLTFPTGAIPLPLSPSLRPRSDAYGVANLSVEGSRRWGHGQIEANGVIKARRHGSVNDFDTLEIQAGAAYASNAPAFDGEWGRWLPGPWRVGTTFQHLQLGGHTLLNSLSFSGVHAWTGLRCSPQGSLELDLRRFPTAPNLDSTLGWAGISVSCPRPWLGADGGWNAQWRIGHEAGRNDERPGGDTWHQELTLTHHWAWGPAAARERFELLAQWVRASDTDGYSVLLGNNARRRVVRATVGASYTFPLPLPASLASPQWQGTLTLQGFHQRSNLELFRLQGHAVQFTVQRSF